MSAEEGYTKRESWSINAMIISMIIAALIAIGISYKINEYGTFNSCKNSSASDCDIQLPSDLRIVYNKDKHRYAVEITDRIWGKRYLWARFEGWIDDNYQALTDFTDSCKAKSFAKQYLKEKAADAYLENSYK